MAGHPTPTTSSVLLAAALACLAWAAPGVAATRDADVVPGRYIVVFKPSVTNPAAETARRERAGGFRARFRYSRAVKGFAARLSDAQANRLRRDPDVAFVSPDRVVRATGWVPLAAGEPVPPTGVRRIDAAAMSSVRERSSVNVAVIDTGIDLSHPDLDAVSGRNCVGSGAAQDDNGHGTHVAGTIAARNNGAGVVGVAPGTRVYAAKVLGASGSGTTAQVVCGIDWVTANAAALNIKVANMSLGGTGPPVQSCAATTDPEHLAICNSTAAGVTYVVAAGNSGWDFDFASQPDVPAAYPQVLTVTAMSDSDGAPGAAGGSPTCRRRESDDRYASFSNYAATPGGQSHTIAGPGVCIRSTWAGGGYDTISGTSMASPHLAGSVALCLGEGSTPGPCAGLTPAEIVQRMRTTAADRIAAVPGYGFDGDPSRAVGGRYYGHLAWDGPAPSAIALSPASLPPGVTGSSYGPVQLTTSGGSGSYTFALASGSLPPGVGLSSAGVLSGTPTATGSFNFTVRATDTADGAFGSRAYTISVSAPSGDGGGGSGSPPSPPSSEPSPSEPPPPTGEDPAPAPRPSPSLTTPLAPALIDTVSPRVAILRLSASAFRAARTGPAARAAAPVGTRVSWRLSEAARVTFRVERAGAGRRVGGRCLKPSRANRRRPACTRWVAVRGSFSWAGVAGLNAVRFTGRIGGRALAVGRYRLVVSARDAAGNAGPAQRIGFRIVSI